MNGLWFAELVGLTVGTTRRLFEATGNKGFETVRLSGLYDGIEFEARWTWYLFADGIARQCGEAEYSLSNRTDLGPARII